MLYGSLRNSKNPGPLDHFIAGNTGPLSHWVFEIDGTKDEDVYTYGLNSGNVKDLIILCHYDVVNKN